MNEAELMREVHDLRLRLREADNEVAQITSDYEECSIVLQNTRRSVVDAMDEIRVALGVPIGKDDKSPKRAIDYVKDQVAETQRLAKALNNVQDERATSFARLSKAVGGTSLTEYQPEIDLEIETAIKSLVKDRERLDWMENNVHALYYGLDCCVCVRGEDGAEFSAETWRAAIDMARVAAKNNSTKS